MRETEKEKVQESMKDRDRVMQKKRISKGGTDKERKKDINDILKLSIIVRCYQVTLIVVQSKQILLEASKEVNILEEFCEKKLENGES